MMGFIYARFIAYSAVLHYHFCRHPGAASETRKGPVYESGGIKSSFYCSRNTVIVFGPWAPSTNDCSMSAVLLGPAINTPNG